MTETIGNNVAEFLAARCAPGASRRNSCRFSRAWATSRTAVLGALGNQPEIPDFRDVHRGAAGLRGGLLENGAVKFASTCSLTLSAAVMQSVYDNLEWFRPRILMRPQEITNHPEVDPPAGHHLDQHGDRNRHLRQRELHARDGPADDERHRRLGRFHAQRLPVDVHLPLDREGRQDQHHRPAGEPHGPQRALGADCRHRAGHRGPARQGSRTSARCSSSRTARTPISATSCAATWTSSKAGHTPQTLSAAFAMHANLLEPATCAASIGPSGATGKFDQGLWTEPSSRLSAPRFRPAPLAGNFAAAFSSISIPNPGLSFEYM